MAVTDQQVREFLSTPRSDAEIAAAMAQFGVPAEQVSRVTGVPTAEVQQRATAASGGMMTGAAAPTTAAPTATATPAPQSAENIRNFLARNPNIDANQIAAAMNKYGVSANEVADALDVPVSQVKKEYDKAMALRAAAAKGEVPTEVKNALESQSLTKEQYSTLAAYFNNDMVLDEQIRDPNTPTLKNFLGRTTGADFAGFLATRFEQHGGDPAKATAAYQQLIKPYQGKEVEYRVDDQGNYFVKDPITGKETQAVDIGGGRFSAGLATLGGSGQYEAGGFALSNTYTFDPATGKATFAAPDIQYVPPSQNGFKRFASIALPLALAAIPGMQGFATTIGTALGATGAAATALGSGILAGTANGIITGDAKSALITGITAGAGNYLINSGIGADLLNKVGLGEVATSLNLPEVGTGAFDMGGAAGTGLMDYTNLNTGAFDMGGAAGTNLVGGAQGTGMFTGGGQATGAFDVGGAAGTDLLGTGTSVGTTTGTGAFDMGGAEGTGLLGPAPVTNLDFPYNPNYQEPGLLSSFGNLGGAVATMLASGATISTIANQLGLDSGQVQQIANAITGGGGGTGGTGGGAGGGNLLSNLIRAGIDYATAERIANQLRGEAAGIQQQARQIGQEAQAQFTPYTLTTGTGTTTIGPSGATSLLSPELQTLQQQQIGLAGQTFGAINPAQASQTLYGQVEALAAPGREREQEALLSRLGARGLLGIGRNLPTVGGGVAGVNPFVESLLSAQESARAQQALQATQFGTSEALRQQQLGQGLQAGALALDTQALNQLGRAQGLSQDQINLAIRNAEARRSAGLTGLTSSIPLQLAASNIQAGQTAGIGQQAQNLAGGIFNGITSSIAPSLFSTSVSGNPGFSTDLIRQGNQNITDIVKNIQNFGGTANNPWYG